MIINDLENAKSHQIDRVPTCIYAQLCTAILYHLPIHPVMSVGRLVRHRDAGVPGQCRPRGTPYYSLTVVFFLGIPLFKQQRENNNSVGTDCTLSGPLGLTIEGFGSQL